MSSRLLSNILLCAILILSIIVIFNILSKSKRRQVVQSSIEKKMVQSDVNVRKESSSVVSIIGLKPEGNKDIQFEKKKELPSSTSLIIEGIDFITTDNYANLRLEYYYYIPSMVIKNKINSYPLLIMVPPLSGRGEQFVGFKVKRFADTEGFIIISPSFVYDEKNWDSQASYQYPSVWSGNALLEIINQTKEKLGINISGLYLFGFSAGAQVALRFALWQPQMCTACAAHGAGGTILPDRNIGVKFFITVGQQDTMRIDKAKNFYQLALTQGIDVIFKEYNAGHSLTNEQIIDSIEFFKNMRR